MIKIHSKSFKSSSFKIERKNDDIYQIDGKIFCHKEDAQGIFLLFEDEFYWPFLYFKLIYSKNNDLGEYVLKIGYHSKKTNQWGVFDKILNIDILENNSYKVQITKESVYLTMNDKDLGRCDLEGLVFPKIFYIKNIQDNDSNGNKDEVTLKTYIGSIAYSEEIKINQMINTFNNLENE